MKVYIVKQLKDSMNIRIGEQLVSVKVENKEEGLLGNFLAFKNKKSAIKIFGKKVELIEVII